MTDPRADELTRGYASIARAYREHLLDELTGKPLDRAFLDAFAERCHGGLVVDVGCGPGHVAGYLAARGIEVEGLDLSIDMIEQARACHPAVASRVGDLFALPSPDRALAGIVAFYAIVHLPTDELVAPCRELGRVIRPGGLVAVAFHAGSERVHVDELWGCATSRRSSSTPASRSKRASIALHTRTSSTRANERTCWGARRDGRAAIAHSLR